MGDVVSDALDVLHAAVEVLEEKGLAAGEVVLGQTVEILTHGKADFVDDLLVGQEAAEEFAGGVEDQFAVDHHAVNADLGHATEFLDDGGQSLFGLS